MIIKLFGVADLLVALAFMLNSLFDKTSNWFPDNIVLILAIYLLVKGIFFVFTWDLASIIDIICGILVILSLYLSLPAVLSIIIVIFIIQKAVFSLIS